MAAGGLTSKTRTRLPLATAPVVPDTAVARDAAPELAALVASPVMWASPVVPESPELPDAAEPSVRAVPLVAPS